MKYLFLLLLCGITIIYLPDGSIDYEAINNQMRNQTHLPLPNSFVAENVMD